MVLPFMSVKDACLKQIYLRFVDILLVLYIVYFINFELVASVGYLIKQ